MLSQTYSHSTSLHKSHLGPFSLPVTNVRNTAPLRLYCLLILFLAIFPAPSNVLAQTPEAHQGARQADDADTLMRIFDTIISHHINSPTRQQLVLDAIADLHDASKGHFDRKRWAVEVSKEADPTKLTAMIRDFLSDRSIEFTVDRFPSLNQKSVTLLSTKEANVSQQIAANRYVGIGVALRKDGQQPAQFMQIVPGGSAASVGIQEGDLLLEADGKSMVDLPLADIIDCLRGPEGSELKLKIRSPDQRKESDLTLTRLVVPFKTVMDPVYSKSKKSVYLSLTNITASSVHELRQIAAGLDEQVERVAIGTRANTSDVDLHHVTLLASGLYGSGKLGPLITNDGTTQQFKLSGEPIFGNRKVLVVVDSSSPSVWAWLASGQSEREPANVDSSFYNSQFINGNKPQGQNLFASGVTDYYAQLEWFPWHFQSIGVTGTDVTVTLPTGIFCDLQGRPLRPSLVPPQPPSILMDRNQRQP